MFIARLSTSTALFLIIFAASASSQNPECPTITVSGPSHAVRPGQNATFDVSINGTKAYDSNPVQWLISSGRIVSGQGTRKLVVAMENKGENLTVTAQVFGLPEKCEKSASETAPPWDPPSITLFDEQSGWAVTNADAIREQLARDPSANIYILIDIVTADDASVIETAVSKRLRALARESSVQIERVNFIVERGLKRKSRFYLVPDGAVAPECDKKSDVCVYSISGGD
jgi:hypothetical protein